MSNWYDSKEVCFAVTAVREAARLVREIQTELVSGILTKEDRSPVTVADFVAQAVISRRLEETFPAQKLVGEESADQLRTEEQKPLLQQITKFVTTRLPDATPESVCRWIDRGTTEAQGTYWTLDPIDGTKGFIRGDQYAVAFALIVNGVVEIGVLGCPQLEAGHRGAIGGAGSLLVAVRGKGTWLSSITPTAKPATTDRPSDETTNHSLDDASETNMLNPADWQQIQVSNISDPANARMMRSVEAAHTNQGQIGQLAELLKIQAAPIGMDSQAKYSVVASGNGEFIIRMLSAARPDYREMIWDQAAGMLVVEEAGGKVTDLDGKKLDFSHGRTLAKNRGVLATNGQLHEQILAALKQLNR